MKNTLIEKRPVVLAIDQGTTSSRAVLFGEDASLLFSEQQEFAQFFPENGWVEHSPEDLWSSSRQCIQSCISAALENNYRIVCAGITNQRETSLLWRRDTGEAIYNAIVWQDRRTAATCADLIEKNHEPSIREKTGLLLDPYFSASKFHWLLNNAENAEQELQKNNLAAGTVDTWLIWKLTQGKVHATDASNASRTSLFNIYSQEWDETLLKIFDVPISILPEVKDSNANYGAISADLFDGLENDIPITGVVGDQQAAAIGQCCFSKGDVKSTYGTGCFVLINTGDKAVTSKHRLLTTIASRLDGKTQYALEGSVYIAGAAIQWLRDSLGVLKKSSDAEQMALLSDLNQNIYFVPAFTGLGAPWWNSDARGSLSGLTRSTGPNEIVRAGLEASSYQTFDLLDAVAKDGVEIGSLKVDGGMANNNWFLQHLSNILNKTLVRPSVVETTALGAAFTAMLGAKMVNSTQSLTSLWQSERSFNPHMEESKREASLKGWKRAVEAVNKL